MVRVHRSHSVVPVSPHLSRRKFLGTWAGALAWGAVGSGCTSTALESSLRSPSARSKGNSTALPHAVSDNQEALFFLAYDKVYQKKISLKQLQLWNFSDQSPKPEVPFRFLLVAACQAFVGAPYVAGMLDGSYPEALVVRLDAFDCVTYVEVCLALARCVHTQQRDFETFKAHLKTLRYRSSPQTGEPVISYSQRLHYFTDWMVQAQNRNWIQVVQGPDEFRPQYGLLSRVTKRLASKNEILGTEEALKVNRFPSYSCHSTWMRVHRDRFLEGDIVAFTTQIDGLDVNHVGILAPRVPQEDRQLFFHASSEARQVVLSEKDVTDACYDIRSNMGIIVARPSL